VTRNVENFQLVLSWHMKAGTMCEFSKKEFIEGLQSLGYVFCDFVMIFCFLKRPVSVENLKNLLQDWFSGEVPRKDTIYALWAERWTYAQKWF